MAPAANVGFCTSWPTGRPAPDHQGIQVIAVDLDFISPQPDLLNAEEQARGARFRSAAHRQQYLTVHTVLRLALGAVLRIPPAEVRFARTPAGKPYLVDHAFSFNLSHSAGRALIALARQGQIGIDLEHPDHLGEPDTLSERVLTPAERPAWLALPPTERAVALLHCWTRKEAILKAIGLGLPGGMEHIVLGESPLRIIGDRTALPSLAGLQIRDLPVDAGYGATLAIDGPLTPIALMRWPTA
jgi:4'-phosphopantetheinyl transferase